MTKADEGQAKGATQVFRDVGTLLLLVLLVVSVRFERTENPQAVEPLPVGVQAGELDEAAAIAEPAVASPAAACPQTRQAVLQPTDAAALLETVQRARDLGQRLLVLQDGKIREIRFSNSSGAAEASRQCDEGQTTLVRS